MKITIVGAGHIGVINAYCLGKLGHEIELVDIDEEKVGRFKDKTPLFLEKDLDWPWLFSHARCSLKLDVSESDLVLVCIDAPVVSGVYNYDGIKEILKICSSCKSDVVIRSTFGAKQLDEISKFCAGVNCIYWPEFLREGSAIKDFKNDSALVAPFNGGNTTVFERINLPSGYASYSNPKVLAAVKVYSNAYRALKTSFGNSVGLALSDLEVDAEEFFEAFIGLRGNCDSLYLRPGDPYGGFCLPKETDACSTEISKYVSNSANIFKCSNLFNQEYIARKVNEIVCSGIKSILFYGVEFKKGTSDVRNSPYLEIANELKLKGILVYIDSGIMSKGFERYEHQNVDAIFLRQFDDYEKNSGVGLDAKLFYFVR